MGIRRKFRRRPEETRIEISSGSLGLMAAGAGAQGKGENIVERFSFSLCWVPTGFLISC